MPVSVIGRFLAMSLLWLLVLLLPWYFMAPVLAAPAIGLAGEIMDGLFGWVETVERLGTLATLVTRVPLRVPQGGSYALAVMTPEVDFLIYGYGVVLLWALLLASRPARLVGKGILGSLALIPFQTWGLCFEWLKVVAIQGGSQATDYIRIPIWTLEVIAFCYQFGLLVLTPLAPVVLWLLLDRRFITTLWLEATLAGQMEARGRPGDADKCECQALASVAEHAVLAYAGREPEGEKVRCY